MPYPSYAYLTDQDVADMYAYFMKGVEPVEHANLDNDIPFPLSMRFPLAIWRKAFGADPDAVVFDTKRYPNEEIARGAYLVQGPGHCGACHTPRTATMAEKGLDEKSRTTLQVGRSLTAGSQSTCAVTMPRVSVAGARKTSSKPCPAAVMHTSASSEHR